MTTATATATANIKKIIVSPVDVFQTTANDTANTEIAQKLEGHFIEADKYNRIITDSCDLYGKQPGGELKLLAKFRKNVIPQAQCQLAWHALHKFAQQWNDNRGAAAGMLKLNKLPAHVRSNKITKQHRYRVFYKSLKGNKSVKANVGNEVRSNIIGFYDRPDRNQLTHGNKMVGPPCRTTAFTRDHVDKWTDCLPLIQSVDKQFAKLVPDRHRVQLARCRLTPKFQIKNTAFSTVTINYNYRTAVHKDSGDLDEGFGNLIVLEKNKCVAAEDTEVNSIKHTAKTKPSTKNKTETKNKTYPYTGGYLGFPMYGVCIDVRQGDFLAMDVHEWHGNTRIECGCPAGKKCRQDGHHGRLSMVFYLRKKMSDCATNNH
jgi:hypothetical protein